MIKRVMYGCALVRDRLFTTECQLCLQRLFTPLDIRIYQSQKSESIA